MRLPSQEEIHWREDFFPETQSNMIMSQTLREISTIENKVKLHKEGSYDFLNPCHFKR